MAPISLRFKRKEVTVFLACDSGDSFRKVKLRLAEAMAVKGGAENVKLFHEDNKEKEYLDDQLLSDYAFTDDSILLIALGGETLS